MKRKTKEQSTVFRNEPKTNCIIEALLYQSKETVHNFGTGCARILIYLISCHAI
jgi:hypothetical protein